MTGTARVWSAVNESELFDQLRNLRTASTASGRAKHKPLLLLWLFGRYVKSHSTEVTYAEAEEQVGQLLAAFGPADQSSQRDRAAMPFVHLERRLWELHDGDGQPIPPTPSRSGSWLRRNSAYGRLRPEVVAHLSEARMLFAAAEALRETYLNEHPPEQVFSAVGLDRTFKAHSRAAALATAAAKPIKTTIDASDYDSRLRRQAFTLLT